MKIRIDADKLRGILASQHGAGNEKSAMSDLLYRVPPLLGGQAAAQSVVEFLAGIPAFGGITKKELAQLALLMHERSYGDGESIFEQGTPSAALYLIRNGSVELTRKTAGMDSVLATLGPNELFGEISLLIEEGPRHAGARSRGPSDLLALSRPDFETLMAKSPLVSVRFLRALAGIVAERFRLLMEAIEGGSVE